MSSYIFHEWFKTTEKCLTGVRTTTKLTYTPPKFGSKTCWEEECSKLHVYSSLKLIRNNLHRHYNSVLKSAYKNKHMNNKNPTSTVWNRTNKTDLSNNMEYTL